ncbi:RtcB family protein, partial [Lysinibacillus sp. D4A3_S15]|uniref:RtcB family protein n=1 Tax=Lysinibacillus sp. D4A3_S15 TaxID=2941227 RepID=UPI0020C001D8
IDTFNTIHNYIETETVTLRKGAVRANKGENLVIPMNMCDGSLICIGKGNADWNNSAPHGAGRMYSRRAAKKALNMEDFKETMEGIWTTSVNEETLD